MPKELKSDLHKVVGQARSILEDLHRLGLGEVYRHPDQSAEQPLQAVSSQGENDSLSAMRQELGDCHRCALANKRTNIVFGAGDPNAEIVFIGEEPNVEDDRIGEPFTGEPGRLFDRILLAMGLQRSDVYCVNIVKCRPPENHAPQLEELTACAEILSRQVDLIRPQIVITLGSLSTQTLLQSEMPIAKLRGQWQRYKDIPLMPTYHPAYLLKNPQYKREVWDDMKAVLKQRRDLQDVSC